MTSDPERSLAKKNSRAVLAMFHNQRLRSHSQNFSRRPQQVGFIAPQHFDFRVVDEQHVHHLQRPLDFRSCALYTLVDGVAAGEAHSVHLAANQSLQIRMNVGEEKKLGVAILVGNARLKFFENVQFGEISLSLVKIVHVVAAPAKGLPFRSFDSACVDLVLLEDLKMLICEIIADDAHHSYLREIACSKREKSRSTAQQVLGLARR